MSKIHVLNKNRFLFTKVTFYYLLSVNYCKTKIHKFISIDTSVWVYGLDH